MISKVRNLVSRLLEAVAPSEGPLDGRDWPEFVGMTDAEWEDYLWNLPTVWLDDGGETMAYGMDVQHNFIMAQGPRQQSFRFDTDEELADFLEMYEAGRFIDSGAEVDSKKHVYTYHREPDVPKYSVEQKRAHLVFEYGPYIFLKLPTDPDFIRREGIDMQHCLSVAHHSYCDRMKKGEIEVYSMTDTRDGLPKVDIEVALLRGSYSNAKIEKPAITQIRGMRNELPPKDDYLEALMAFFTDYGKNWTLSGHGVRNFDGRVDGDLVVRRWQELQGERASAQT